MIVAATFVRHLQADAVTMTAISLAMIATALSAAGVPAADTMTSAAEGAAPKPFRLPVPMVWQVDFNTLSRRQYLKDIAEGL